MTLKQDFSITKPKIAVLALNPHAGDNGVIGKEAVSYTHLDVYKRQGSSPGGTTSKRPQKKRSFLLYVNQNRFFYVNIENIWLFVNKLSIVYYNN